MSSQKETVIITGSSGLIGSATAKWLAPLHAVVGFDVVPPAVSPSNVEWMSVDLTSPESIRKGLNKVSHDHGERVASVIHLAGYYDSSGEPSPKYEAINIQGTQHLLQELQRFHVEQFIYSSTMLVHAPCQPGARINEDWPLEPKWAYPQSNAKAEDLVLKQQGTMPVVLLRIAGVYDDNCHSAPLAQQMQRIYERRLISHVFPGDSSHGQSYIHLDDLVEALALTVERRQFLPSELRLLLGELQTVSYAELQRQLGLLLHNEQWETTEIPKPLAKAGAWLKQAPGEDPFVKPWMIDIVDDHYALDTRCALAVLGWQPKHSLRASLSKMAAALKNDPLAWYRTNKLQVPPWLEEAANQSPVGSLKEL